MRKKQAYPRKVDRRYKRYDGNALKLAFQAVAERRIPVKRAARMFGVPITTLRDRVAGRVDPEKDGPDTLFTKDEESKLVEHLKARAALGYGMSNVMLKKIAGEMAYELGKKTSSCPLSNMWLYAFLRRWSEHIASMKPRNLETARAKNTTPEAVQHYFDNLEEVLIQNNLTDKPHRIFNLDETGLQPEHKQSNVIGDPRSKVQAITSPKTTTTTVIGCVNALGTALPPYFIFKGKRWNQDLMKGACTGARGTMSDSGWSNSTIFKQYLQEHFLQFVSPPSPEDPILLIYDGHASHKNPETIHWAKDKGIILFVLPAHSSHLLQPLDVAVFGPFKKHYYSECSRFMYTHMGQVITRYDICALASNAFLKAFSPINIQSGFRKTGIHPLQKNVIDTEKFLPCESFREQDPISKAKAVRAGPEQVELFLKQKEAKIREQGGLTEKESESACHIKKNSRSNIPNPSGRAITNADFISELNVHEKNKQLSQKQPNSENIRNKNKKSNPCSPKASTSGLQISNTPQMEDISDDSEVEYGDEEKCCVCHCYEPEKLKHLPYLKLVKWAKCDFCEHWVHLAFCTTEKSIRRQSKFSCPHCIAN